MKPAKHPEYLLEKNNLLRKLNSRDKERLLPLVTPFPLEAGASLFEPGDDVQSAYFPCGPALVSFMVTLEDARAVETALIGLEGAVGGIVSNGHLPAYCKAEVRFSGMGLRIASRELERAKAESPAIAHLFARYADCLIAQVFQAVACNATHTIEQRTAKWLLGAICRTSDRTIPITQEQLASMLGVGRSYIARVMAAFKANGSVETRRGRMLIKDTEQLQAMACSCNSLVHDHFETVLRGVYPAEQS